MKTHKLPFLFYLLLAGCFETESKDPIEAYKLWSHEDPPGNIKVIKGQYWKSGHWTNEYIVYLKIKAPYSWRNAYIIKNHLVLLKDTMVVKGNQDPDWFNQPKNSNVYEKPGFWQGSVYFDDTLSGTLLIHEVQL